MTRSASPRMRVATFNIRVATDEENDLDTWPNRVGKVASVVRLHEPAVVGVQEALDHQLGALRERLGAYEWIGVGRQDGEREGEHVPIGYKSERFELLESDTFWLSPAPDAPGSVGWDADLPRILTWARLVDQRTDVEVLHCNTHFDHSGERARLESARLLRQTLPEIAEGSPIVLTGDFNCTPTSEPYRVLTDRFTDAKAAASYPHHGPAGTVHSFTGDPGDRIDYVFVEGCDVRQHATLVDHWDGRYPSDHFPVLAECRPGE